MRVQFGTTPAPVDVPTRKEEARQKIPFARFMKAPVDDAFDLNLYHDGMPLTVEEMFDLVMKSRVEPSSTHSDISEIKAENETLKTLCYVSIGAAALGLVVALLGKR